MIVDVIDLNFKVLNFTRNYDNERERKARRIYNYKYVTIKKVDMKYENSKNVYDINAEVIGNYDDYDVNLKIKDTTLIE